MAGPRHSVRNSAKRHRPAKPRKPAKKPKKALPLMHLNNDILYEIIYQVEKGRSKYSYEGGLGQKKYAIKDLKNLSLVNKRLRDLSLPTLFKYARIADSPSAVKRRGLDFEVLPLVTTLNIMAQKSLILNSIRYLVLEIFETKMGENIYHFTTPDALWTCLKLMPSLKEISVRLRGCASLVPLLESHLAHSMQLPTLPTVRSISFYTSPSTAASKFVKLTPNIEQACIEIPRCVRHNAQLLALSELPKLKYLMLCRVVPRPRRGPLPAGWCIDDIQAIAELVPDIKHLALVGQLDDFRDDDARVSNYIESFGKFTQLEKLDMTDEYVVDADLAEDTVAHTSQLIDDATSEDLDGLSEDLDGLSEDLDGLSEDLHSFVEGLAEEHALNEERAVLARKFFEKCPTLRQVYLTRCENGELFERGEGSEVKMARSVGAEDAFDYEFPFHFPRVLEVNDTPRPAVFE